MSVAAIYLLFSMLAVIWFDVTRYIIPNWLVGSLLLLYPVAVYMSPVAVDWKLGLAAMGIVFFAGYLLFTFKFMGGGDIKLITVLALWVGLSHLLDFIFLVALFGGALSVIIWIMRKAEAYIPHKATLPRILRNGEPVPYGIAIAIGMLVTLWLGSVSVATLH